MFERSDIGAEPAGPSEPGLLARLAGTDVLGSMGRRRYLVTTGGDEHHRLVGEEVEHAAGARQTGRRSDEWALLLERAGDGLQAVGSLRLEWPAGVAAGVLELSGLNLPAESWRPAGVLGERSLLLLRAGVRRAQQAGALALFLLAAPPLVESLEHRGGFFRLARGRPAPPGLAWAVAAPAAPPPSGGFEAVLAAGCGLERLTCFVDGT